MVNIRQAFRGEREKHVPEEPQTAVLVPIGGTGEDTRLLRYVEKIARKRHANVTIIYVVEVPQTMPLDAELPQDVQHGEDVLQTAQAFMEQNLEPKSSLVSTELLQARAAGAAIVDEASLRNVNMIIMGAHLSRKHGKLTVGETVDYVLKHATCEVLVLRSAMSEELMTSLEVDVE